MVANSSNSRPLAVAIIGWIFIVTGGILIVASLVESPLDFWALLTRVLALVAGVFMLPGKNWARWLAIAWLGFHVGLSLAHTTGELVAHSLFLVAAGFFLFRPAASVYFHGTFRESAKGEGDVRASSGK